MRLTHAVSKWRPKRFIGWLIAFTISAVIILASVSVATVSLTKSTHAAQVVNPVVTDVTQARITQAQIGNGIMHRLRALEVAIGGRQRLQCDWQRDKICVTPSNITAPTIPGTLLKTPSRGLFF